MGRRFLVLGGAAALLVGCLFPSFDNLRSNDVAPGDDDDDKADDSGSPSNREASSAGGSSSGTTNGSSSSGGATTSSSSSASSSGGSSSSGAASQKLIHCRALSCTGDTICCAPIIGEYECQPLGAVDCDENDVLECDGTKDCPAGQICCQAGPAGGAAKCQAAPCSSATYCAPDDPACPGGTTCSGDAIGGPDNYKKCQ